MEREREKETVWCCKNDEHVNRIEDIKCEICDLERPVVNKFYCTPTDTYGKVEVHWNVDYGDFVKIINGKEVIPVEKVSENYILNGVTNNSKIYLEVDNLIATVKEETLVQLCAPEITTFETDKAEVIEGKEIILKWSTKNATEIKITNVDSGVLTECGLLSKKIIRTTKFILTARNPIAEITKEIQVIGIPAPVIRSFKAKNLKVEYGKAAELVWNVTNSAKTILEYDDKVEVLSGEMDNIKIPITKDTAFKLTAVSLDNSFSVQEEFRVCTYKKVIIDGFTSDYEFVLESVPVRLKWNVENAKTVLLCANLRPDMDVTGLNEIELTINKTTIFFIRAYNDMFENQSRIIKIVVQPLPSIERIDSFIPPNTILLRNFKLNFEEFSNHILTETQDEFERMVRERRRFMFTKKLRRLIKVFF